MLISLFGTKQLLFSSMDNCGILHSLFYLFLSLSLSLSHTHAHTHTHLFVIDVVVTNPISMLLLLMIGSSLRLCYSWKRMFGILRFCPVDIILFFLFLVNCLFSYVNDSFFLQEVVILMFLLFDFTFVHCFGLWILFLFFNPLVL
jgi:hypothetical protein